MAVPGRMTVIDSTYDEAYGDEEVLAVEFAEALNPELRGLREAAAANCHWTGKRLPTEAELIFPNSPTK